MALSGFLVFTDKTQVRLLSPSLPVSIRPSSLADLRLGSSIGQANILNNFPQNDILINIARLCFGLNMFTTLPLEAFVCREVS